MWIMGLSWKSLEGISLKLQGPSLTVMQSYTQENKIKALEIEELCFNWITPQGFQKYLQQSVFQMEALRSVRMKNRKNSWQKNN